MTQPMRDEVDETEDDADRYELQLLRAGYRRFFIVGAALLVLSMWILLTSTRGVIMIGLIIAGCASIARAQTMRAQAQALEARMRARFVRRAPPEREQDHPFR